MAAVLTERNEVEERLARLLGRPASAGAVGEWIAARVFDIRLEDAGNHRGFDGRFTNGPMAGRSVNIKLYGRRDVLDITQEALPDYYLALTGPKGDGASTRGTHVPIRIAGVYLFDAPTLVSTLRERGVQVGVASSVRTTDWEAAQIYPAAEFPPLELSQEQQQMLALFRA